MNFKELILGNRGAPLSAELSESTKLSSYSNIVPILHFKIKQSRAIKRFVMKRFIYAECHLY
jgi:hypothetical protein